MTWPQNVETVFEMNHVVKGKQYQKYIERFLFAGLFWFSEII